MAKEKTEEMKLPSLDELFSSQEERDDAKLKRIYELPLSEIDPFPDHPFHVRDDEDMMNLVESVTWPRSKPPENGRCRSGTVVRSWENWRSCTRTGSQNRKNQLMCRNQKRPELPGVLDMPADF